MYDLRMPVLHNELNNVKTDEQVFDIANNKTGSDNDKDILYQTMNKQTEPLKSYQKLLLLTEVHLMSEDTGPLSVSVRDSLASMVSFYLFPYKYHFFVIQGCL